MRPSRTSHRPLRRAFNMIELLIALAISAALLTATMVALNASFVAYQSTTEVASTHTIGRLVIHRIMALVRTGKEFGPLPASPLDRIVASDYIEFTDENNQVLTIQYDADDQTLSLLVTDPDTDATTTSLLLENVQPQLDEDGDPVSPFTLEYEKGRYLYRATVDLAIAPDDNMSVSLDGDNAQIIRLVASAMPRVEAY